MMMTIMTTTMTPRKTGISTHIPMGMRKQNWTGMKMEMRIGKRTQIPATVV